jgi:hypothetical protein
MEDKIQQQPSFSFHFSFSRSSPLLGLSAFQTHRMEAFARRRKIHLFAFGCRLGIDLFFFDIAEKQAEKQTLI